MERIENIRVNVQRAKCCFRYNCEFPFEFAEACYVTLFCLLIRRPEEIKLLRKLELEQRVTLYSIL